jgi:hypothetical protein
MHGQLLLKKCTKPHKANQALMAEHRQVHNKVVPVSKALLVIL